jgi:hypothetical protein
MGVTEADFAKATDLSMVAIEIYNDLETYI